MATRPVFVVILSRETPFFGDEIHSRRHFLAGKLHLLATRPFLVVTLRREASFFGDETLSRRHFEPKNAYFWRQDSFSSSL
ncbi:hypothetical protein [Caldibacillus thermoamylovorans]|uniref:hypothetical protein n=1 Tax=Caldibacillus thermoamylovorans TaxID=35841 RepID=UPI0012602646|nr:hypothetical protein [Caldibacillus thermoamylovorans]